MGALLAKGADDADLEGKRTVGFGEGMRSTFEPLSSGAIDDGATKSDSPFPTNFVRVSKYPSYASLWFSFTFTDFFVQVSV
jgi:hypothetical protein